MRARHVVVPVIAVGLAAVLWLWPANVTPIVDMSTDVSECAANLSQIYGGFILYDIRQKHPPRESGVRMLGELIASGALEDTPESRARLTCPGPNAELVDAGVDFHDLARLTGADSAYAARDTVGFPLAKFPSGGSEIEPLVACDNAHGMNHRDCMNVLYSDGSVVTLFLAEEIEAGRLPAGTKTISVGKESPIPDLRKLAAD
jgi:hypothetical protein